MAGKFCPNCGAPLEDAAKFCPGCGTQTVAAETQAAAQPMPQTMAQQQPYPGYPPQPFQQAFPQPQPYPMAPAPPPTPAKKKKRTGLIVFGAVLLALVLAVTGLIVYARGALGRAAKADYLEYDGDKVASVKLALGEKREIVGINTSADILSAMFGTTKTWIYQVPGTQQNREMSAYYDYLCEKDGFSRTSTANFDGPSGEAYLERNSVDSGYQLILTIKYDETGYAISIRKLQGQVTPALEVTEPWYAGEETTAQANSPGERVTDQQLTLHDGRTGLYTGTLADGKPEGDGTFLYDDNGAKYTGEWKNGMREGQGTYTWATGTEYTGEWAADMRHGRGVTTWANGDKYDGDYKDDNRDGQGALTWADGGGYTGGWKDDIKNGQGTFTWASGDQYVGEFKNDIRNGQGTMTWTNGDQYAGEYKDDIRNGQGTMTWANGDKYVGEWKNDKRDGQGALYNADGTVKQQGQWKEGEFVG